jgi:hypothetical protein
VGIEGIRPTGVAEPGDVNLIFHTYSGFLVFFTQMRHDVVLPADQARILLKRLLRHNLTWGLFAAGGVFVPILSYFEYRSQSKRITSVLRQGFPVVPPKQVS